MKSTIKYYLESLLRGERNGVKYSLDMCAYDIEQVHDNIKKINAMQFSSRLDFLVNICCETFGCNVDDIKGKSRKREISIARQTIMYILANNKFSSLKMIGRILGGRDHATIIHGKCTISNLLKTKGDRYDEVEHIIKSFNEFMSDEEVIIDKETDICNPKKAFPIETLEVFIESKIQTISAYQSSDKEVMRAVNCEKETYKKVKIKIDELKELQ